MQTATTLTARSKRRRPSGARQRPTRVVASEVVLEARVAPDIRPDAVARAREILAQEGWCRPDQIAETLLDGLVTREMP